MRLPKCSWPRGYQAAQHHCSCEHRSAGPTIVPTCVRTSASNIANTKYWYATPLYSITHTYSTYIVKMSHRGGVTMGNSLQPLCPFTPAHKPSTCSVRCKQVFSSSSLWLLAASSCVLRVPRLPVRLARVASWFWLVWASCVSLAWYFPSAWS